MFDDRLRRYWLFSRWRLVTRLLFLPLLQPTSPVTNDERTSPRTPASRGSSAMSLPTDPTEGHHEHADAAARKRSFSAVEPPHLPNTGLDPGHPLGMRFGIRTTELTLQRHQHRHELHGAGRVRRFVCKTQAPGTKGFTPPIPDLPGVRGVDGHGVRLMHMLGIRRWIEMHKDFYQSLPFVFLRPERKRPDIPDSNNRKVAGSVTN